MDKEGMMERRQAKLTSVFVVFILPFVCILAPYWVSPWIARKGRTGERFLCYLMCFGGGIFLGAFFLDAAPEAREKLEKVLLDPKGIVYPVTDLIIGCGFFFVLYLEKIVMRVNKRRMQRKEREMQRCCIVYHGDGFPAAANNRVCRNCRDGLRCVGYVNEGQTTDQDVVVSSRIAIHVKKIEDSSAATTSSSSSSVSSQAKKTATVPEENKGIDVDAVSDVETEGKNVDPGDAASVSSHGGGGGGGGSGGHHDVRSLILIVSLSLHHVFEGLALGLSDGASRVFVLVFALACHETIHGFTLGLQFVRSGYSLRRMLVTGACYSIVLPVGVGVGMTVSEWTEETSASKMGIGAVLAFACGTFVYVTFFDILQEEIDPHDTSLGKVTGATLGFAVVALLLLAQEFTEREVVDKVESLAVEATTVFHENAAV